MEILTVLSKTVFLIKGFVKKRSGTDINTGIKNGGVGCTNNVTYNISNINLNSTKLEIEKSG